MGEIFLFGDILFCSNLNEPILLCAIAVVRYNVLQLTRYLSPIQTRLLLLLHLCEWTNIEHRSYCRNCGGVLSTVLRACLDSLLRYQEEVIEGRTRGQTQPNKLKQPEFAGTAIAGGCLRGTQLQ